MNKKHVTKKESPEAKKPGWKMPSAFTILFAILAVVAVLTWIVPSGQYDRKENDDGEMVPVSGTYKQVDKIQTLESGDKKDVRQDAWDLAKSPITGTVGQAEDKDAGQEKVTAGIEVMLFILVIGGFLGIVMKTGALNAFFGSILKKLKGKEQWLIPILMLFFAAGGTIYGMQEETVAFYALVVPLLLAAGYNGMTAALVIILGSGAGLIGSTLNPFSVGAASGFAGTTIGDGVLERLILLAISFAVMVWFTMRYAAKAKAGKYKNDSKAKASDYDHNTKDIPLFTGRRKAVMWIFGLTFLIMVLSVIPWEWKFNITFFADILAWMKDVPVLGALIGHSSALGDWWFNELSMLFLVASFVVALVYYTGRDEKREGSSVDDFIAGARDLLAVALVVGVARGVTVLMTNGQILDTVINMGENVLNDTVSVLFPAISFIIYLPMSLFIPSSSGLAAATMPIMAPLADFADVPRHLVITAYSAAVAIINISAPTIASVIGGLVLAKVSYVTYIRRTWKLMLLLCLISIVVITISALIS